MKREELLEYFRTERTRFEKTREIQWKFNISFWTLLAVGISFLNGEMFGECKCGLWLAILIFLAAHFLFAYLTQKGLIGSRILSAKILDSLNSSLEDYIKFDTRRIDKLKWKTADIMWIVFQLLGSGSLVIVLLIKLL